MLLIAFHPQTNYKIERQNSIIEFYLQAFVNYELNNWAKLFPMAEFHYNTIKNANISHILFELNCSYNVCILYKKDINPRFRSKSTDKLAVKLRELMTICRKNLQHA